VWLAVPGRGDDLRLPLATPVDQLLSAVLAAGSVTACSQCAGRRELTEDDLLPGVRIAGAAAFVEEITREGVQALVY
jgi:predicted peroxiredoxin